MLARREPRGGVLGGRRRLQDATPENSASSPQVDGQLGITDFVGIILMWAIATAFILCVHMLHNARLRRQRQLKASSTSTMQHVPEELERMAIKLQSAHRGHRVRQKKTAGLLLIDSLFGIKTGEAPSFNSDGAAIRHLVSEMHFLKEYVAAHIRANGIVPVDSQ